MLRYYGLVIARYLGVLHLVLGLLNIENMECEILAVKQSPSTQGLLIDFKHFS